LVPFGQGVLGEKICLSLAKQKQEMVFGAIFGDQNGTERRNFIEDLT
jgi:hypothetical protein